MNAQNELSNYGRQYSAIVWMLVFLLLYLLVNILTMGRFSLHQDEILDWHGQATDTYLVAGRWGLYLFRIVMGEGCYLLCSGLIAGCFIAGAVWLQCELLRLVSPMEKLLYGVFYMASNQFASILEYSFMSDAVAAGVFCLSLSLYFWMNKRSYVSAILLLAVSLSVYQTLGLCFYILWALVMLRENCLSWREVRGFLIICAGSLFSYAAGQWIVTSIVAVPQETIDYVKTYQQSLTQWPLFKELDLSEKMLFLAHYAKVTLYSALGVQYPESLACTSAIIPLVLLTLVIVRRCTKIMALSYVVLLFSVWYLPFCFSLLMGVNMEERVQLAAPARLAGLWVLSFVMCPMSWKWRKLILLFSASCLLKAAYTSSAQARDAAYEYQHAIQELKSIYSKAQEKALSHGLVDYEVVLLGFVPADYRSHSVASPYLINTGIVHWYAKHYRLHGMKNLLSGYEEKYGAVYGQMPHWPHPESVRVHDNSVIVRITPRKTTRS